MIYVNEYNTAFLLYSGSNLNLDDRHTTLIKTLDTNETNIMQPGPEVVKPFSCLTQLSVEFLMLISIKISRMLCLPLINVKMPTIVGILTFMSRKISCLIELSMKKFYKLGTCVCNVCA